jgi:homoserine kinase
MGDGIQTGIVEIMMSDTTTSRYRKACVAGMECVRQLALDTRGQ